MKEKKNFPQKFYDALKLRRRILKLTQKKIAEKIGVNPAIICRIEKGENCVSSEMFKKILSIYGLKDWESLLNGDIQNASKQVVIITKHTPLKFSPLAQSDNLLHGYSEEMVDDEKMFVSFVTIQPKNTHTLPSKHLGEELIYIIEGELEMTIKKNSYCLKKGNLVHFHSDYPHSFKCKDSNPVKILSVRYPAHRGRV